MTLGCPQPTTAGLYGVPYPDRTTHERHLVLPTLNRPNTWHCNYATFCSSLDENLCRACRQLRLSGDATIASTNPRNVALTVRYVEVFSCSEMKPFVPRSVVEPKLLRGVKCQSTPEVDVCVFCSPRFHSNFVALARRKHCYRRLVRDGWGRLIAVDIVKVLATSRREAATRKYCGKGHSACNHGPKRHGVAAFGSRTHYCI